MSTENSYTRTQLTWTLQDDMMHPRIYAYMAEMYRSGGHGLESDCQKAGDLYTEAAEAAMAAMKGKLANKLYMLAEEAWAEVPEED